MVAEPQPGHTAWACLPASLAGMFSLSSWFEAFRKARRPSQGCPGLKRSSANLIHSFGTSGLWFFLLINCISFSVQAFHNRPLPSPPAGCDVVSTPAKLVQAKGVTQPVAFLADKVRVFHFQSSLFYAL